MDEPLSARPEARFALIAGIAGGLVAAAISVKAIFGSASSTAGIGFVFVPFIIAAAMAFAGVWGLALGCVWHSVRGARQYYRAVLLLAWAMTLGVPGYLGFQVWQGLALERAVAETTTMTRAGLERALDDSPWRDNRFFIGALAQHPQASTVLLERIARLPDPQLYEPLGSLWDVKGENRKGLAAMRLVALHPNVEAATLQQLAEGPRPDVVLGDVLRNPKTPMRVLERHFDSKDFAIESGLALNPQTPQAVLERLSRSDNLYTRLNLTYNVATPVPILERLAKDPQPILARNASQALARRAEKTGQRTRPEATGTP